MDIIRIEIPESHKVVPSSAAIVATLKQVRVPRSAPKHNGHYDKGIEVSNWRKAYLSYYVFDRRPETMEANGGRAKYITRCSTRAQATKVARAVLAGAVFGASADGKLQEGQFISGPEWCPGHPSSPRPLHPNIMRDIRKAAKGGYEASIYTRASAAWQAGLISFEQYEAVMEPLRERNRRIAAARRAS